MSWMNKIQVLLILSFSMVFIAACAHSPKTESNAERYGTINKKSEKKLLNHKGQDIAALAKSMLGAPYRYGGSSPNGFDCSGLVYYTHGKLGVKVPRTSRTQFSYAKPIDLNHLQVGDVVFFKLNKKDISHIGIYIGGNRFIHAPKAGKKVSLSHLNEHFWKSRFAGAGRLY